MSISKEKDGVPIHISGTESVVYARGANGYLSYFRIFKDTEAALLRYAAMRQAGEDVVIMDIDQLDNLLR